MGKVYCSYNYLAYNYSVVCVMQGLMGCLPATAPLLAAAAHLAFTTAATSTTAQRVPPSSGGFHSSGGTPALPQEVQLAMHWQHHGAAADEAASSVRLVTSTKFCLLGTYEPFMITVIFDQLSKRSLDRFCSSSKSYANTQETSLVTSHTL